jgi:hypothetical protein
MCGFISLSSLIIPSESLESRYLGIYMRNYAKYAKDESRSPPRVSHSSICCHVSPSKTIGFVKTGSTHTLQAAAAALKRAGQPTVRFLRRLSVLLSLFLTVFAIQWCGKRLFGSSLLGVK